jgi:hypothetical protein
MLYDSELCQIVSRDHRTGVTLGRNTVATTTDPRPGLGGQGLVLAQRVDAQA